MKEDNRESTKESIKRIEEAEKRQGDGPLELTLSTGVVLRVRKVNPVLLSDIASDSLKHRPRIPIAYIESLDRDEENPSDPDYVEEVAQWQAGVLLDINNAYVLMGTEIISVPDDLPDSNDERWLDEMRILGRPVGTERERYLAWIKYVVALDAEDTSAIVREVGRLSGVSESEVKEAVDGFQR